ncbi:acyltransferase [Bacillus sp. Brlt_9]|uniref:acyltransferase n=1 Tax=Bacillus sp. Brlt_9 TaxID=3110916 RepID=UPI003F7BC657
MKWISSLRGIAILAVLMIHVSAPLLYRQPDLKWWIANGFDSISRFAVPLFLMVSGGLLLHKQESTKIYFKKRLSKILIPFIVWSFIYYLYKSSGSFQITEFIQELFSAKVYYHLWYFYIIIPLYLLIPIIRKVIASIPSRFIFFYAIASSIIVTSQNIFSLGGWEIALFSNPFSTSLSYLMLGYTLTHREFRGKYISGLALVSFIVIFIGTYYTSVIANNGKVNEALYDPFGLPVLMYTLCVFYMVKKYQSSAWQDTRSLHFISKYSFGIYLIHPLILNELKNIKIMNEYIFNVQYLNVMVMIPFVFVCLLLLSLILIIVISKIPIINKTI